MFLLGDASWIFFCALTGINAITEIATSKFNNNFI